MKISEIIEYLEGIAPLDLQESYDNAGLLLGDRLWECTGIITTLDATEEVMLEAFEKKCNLVIAHHPIIFGGLKKLTRKNYVEKAVISAVKNDIALYAIHTNLDNVLPGVNGRIADMLGLVNRQSLLPRKGALRKLITYAPVAAAAKVRSAIFEAGGGHIGKYSECSFNTLGKGTFKAGPGTEPYVGNIGEQHTEEEVKIEVIFPAWRENEMIKSLVNSHPYKEVAYDIIPLNNQYQEAGSGIIGELPDPMEEKDFLKTLKETFHLSVIRHTPLTNRPLKRIAVCGGAGSFLIANAIATKADIFITGDVKYHEFFDANGQLLIADIGHYESEQFTIDLLFELLTKKFPTFAIQKTKVKTNPVHYYS